MILASVFSRCMFNFLHADKGITFVDAPELTRQLWTLKLKISKERRKGGVVPLELACGIHDGLGTSSSLGRHDAYGFGHR